MIGLATKSLLIVDYNDVTREGLAAVLSRQGYSFRGAATGEQAMEALRAQRPDLVLLDMLLSGYGDDGWALLAKIRRDPAWRSIPVIIVTDIPVSSEEWAVSLGAQTVVRKPIDTDELLLKIKHHCP
jgi:CheY-like chemotaxis protein